LKIDRAVRLARCQTELFIGWMTLSGQIILARADGDP